MRLWRCSCSFDKGRNEALKIESALMQLGIVQLGIVQLGIV